MKKILILGKRGQLGSELIKDAAFYGFTVDAPSHKELDVSNKSKLFKKIEETKPSIIINTTAYNLVEKAEYEPEEAFKVNSIAVGIMAKICKELHIKFVTFSTDYVFDGQKRTGYLEDDEPNPLQVYGISKLAGEYLARTIYSDSIIIRTNGLYGGKSGSPAKKGNFVLNILRQATTQKSISVVSDQFVNPTYSGHLSRATFELLSNTRFPAGIYHLVNEGACSWFEFTKAVFEIWGIKTQLVPIRRGKITDGVNRPSFSALKNLKARKLGVILPAWGGGLKNYFHDLSNLQQL